jgi:DNA-binding NarL/FixJ family response regulator
MGAGLEALLAEHPALVTVGRWRGLSDLAPQVEAQRPDVLLCELESPDEETRPFLEALGSPLQAPAIVALTDDAHGTWAAELLQAGVQAILPRHAHAAEIVAAIEAVAIGLVVLSADMMEALLLLSSVPRTLPEHSQQALTPRELEVLRMLAEGAGNKTMAWRLGISEHTVKFHLSSIFSKLNASSRTEAVTLAIRQGLIMV